MTAAPTWDSTFDPAEKYGDTAGMFKAAGLGAARSATFGLSDEFLTRSGIMKPEDIAGYKEQNPISTGVGEVGGVLGAVLMPETGILGAVSAPVRAVARAGGAITEAAGAALPEATSTVGKILSQAAAHGAGSAVEGAAYGLGQSVSEHALGDPTLNAEKVLANVGTAGVVGGALGSLFGAAKAGIAAKFPRFIPEADRAAIDAGNFEKTIEYSELPETEKEGILSGLAKKKANASEIESYAKERGLPVSPAQLSDNKFVERSYDMLLNSHPSISSVRQNNLATQGWTGAVTDVENTLGEGAKLTKNELGKKFVQGFSQDIAAQAAPAQELYQEIQPYMQRIPLSDKTTGRIADNIRKLINEHSVIEGTDAHRFITIMADGLEKIENLDQLKNFRTQLGREADQKTGWAAGAIREKLDNLELRAIKRYADTEMKTPLAKNKILGLIDKMGEAKGKWKALRENMEPLGDVFGKRKIYGPQDFLDFLSDGITPEKLAGKVWQRENADFMGWLQKSYPEQFELAKQFRINQLKEAATKKGYFEPKKLFSDIRAMEPEERNFLFTKAQQESLKGAEAYLNSFPKNWNPSGTEYAHALGKFFEGPGQTIKGNIRDYALEKFITNVGSFDPEASNIVNGLSTLERAAQKTTKQIGSGVSAIFSKDAGSPIKGYLAMSSTERRDHHDDMHDKLAGFGASPEKLIEHISENTQGLTDVAPQTSAAAQATMSRATQFLQSKLPQAPEQKPLSPKFKPSEAELAKWHKYFTAVERPTDALHAVAAGTLTPETMEALTVVYPKLLNEMRSAVTDKMTAAMAKKAVIPYRTKMSLSMFLGQDLVDSLNPVSMLANQNTLASATQAKNEQRMAQMSGANKKSLDKMDSSGRLLTSAQKSAQRKEA